MILALAVKRVRVSSNDVVRSESCNLPAWPTAIRTNYKGPGSLKDPCATRALFSCGSLHSLSAFGQHPFCASSSFWLPISSEPLRPGIGFAFPFVGARIASLCFVSSSVRRTRYRLKQDFDPGVQAVDRCGQQTSQAIPR